MSWECHTRLKSWAEPVQRCHFVLAVRFVDPKSTATGGGTRFGYLGLASSRVTDNAQMENVTVTTNQNFRYPQLL